jgi:hypothetical protein
VYLPLSSACRRGHLAREHLARARPLR